MKGFVLPPEKRINIPYFNSIRLLEYWWLSLQTICATNTTEIKIKKNDFHNILIKPTNLINYRWQHWVNGVKNIFASLSNHLTLYTHAIFVVHFQNNLSQNIARKFCSIVSDPKTRTRCFNVYAKNKSSYKSFVDYVLYCT